MAVYRIYTEKKQQFAVEAQSVLSDLRTALQLDVQGIRVLNRYDADHISEEDFRRAVPTVFSEPAVDYIYEKLPMLSNQERVFAVEYLPGQFDQRADSCEQCIQILNGKERCRVRNARVYIVTGAITDEEFDRLRAYLINPVESREASLDTVDTLDMNYALPETVETLTGFIGMDETARREFLTKYGLAMDYDDITFCQAYFRDEEHRDPTITEIRMID
ncbi:MAG: phosphoribosylformylglycinamidine synthase, partial [Oscillospiraceae bacterium]|nr:phosphoribosylformylglycinamidine synthase [Oscillospiraceae bacterium]